MGSGHFLVAAVDRIEKAMSDYLDKRPLKGVQSILNKTKLTAEQKLKGISDDYFPVEPRKYLARHIARHCIYGVDNNDLAVQLAKLSLWTHTCIPGLPLSYFNHNLRCGNSLVGIGTIEELQLDFVNKKDTKNLSFKLIDTNKLIAQAKEPLQKMRKLSDLNPEEVKKSRNIEKEIASSLKDARALFDVTIFNRIKNKGDMLAEDEKNNMIYELDAVVAHLYGLSEKQLIHTFETFHRTWDYKPRLKAVLKYYTSWKKSKIAS